MSVDEAKEREMFACAMESAHPGKYTYARREGAQFLYSGIEEFYQIWKMARAQSAPQWIPVDTNPYEIKVSKTDDACAIYREGRLLWSPIPASDLCALSDAILSALCGPAPATEPKP
jgi:hypothetical protein